MGVPLTLSAWTDSALQSTGMYQSGKCACHYIALTNYVLKCSRFKTLVSVTNDKVPRCWLSIRYKLTLKSNDEERLGFIVLAFIINVFNGAGPCELCAGHG